MPDGTENVKARAPIFFIRTFFPAGMPDKSGGMALAKPPRRCYRAAMSEILTLTVDSLAHDGRGIARLPETGQNSETRGSGTAVFVSGALPGQIVRARIVRRKARLVEADLLDVLRPAPDAVPALCPHQHICGGCPLQIMPYPAQLRWKEDLALAALTRIGHLDRGMLAAVLEPPHPSPEQAAFRNKMEFAFGRDAGGNLILGQRRRGGAGVIAVPGCVLLPAGAQDILAAARRSAEQSGLAPYAAPPARRGPGRDKNAHAAGPHGFWRFLVLRSGRREDDPAPRWWALCVTSPGGADGRAAARALGEDLLGRFPDLAAFVHEERQSPDALAAGERRVLCLNEKGGEEPQAALLHLPLGDRLFALDAASFFQVNTRAAQNLARLAQDMLRQTRGGAENGASLLDLYCGVGAPGQLLAPDYDRLLGLECDKRAVALARRNAERGGLTRCRYEAGDAAALLDRLRRERRGPGWDTVLADPPRAGLAPRVLDGLLALRPQTILYISCNPATLARDADGLQARYSLERLAAVDLFPHTPHLECLSLWRLKS